MKQIGRHKISIRLVIVLIIIFMSVVPTVLVSLTLISSAKTKEIENYSSEVQSQVLMLANKLQNDDYFGEESELAGQNTTDDELLDQIADFWGARVQITDNAGRILHDTYKMDTGKYNISEYVMTALSRSTMSNMDSQTLMFAVAMPIYSKTQTELITTGMAHLSDEEEYGQKVLGCILVTLDMTNRINTISQLSNQSYLLWTAVGCIAMLLAVIILVYVFKPVRQLFLQLDQAYEGTSDRIDVGVYSETARISSSVNRTLDRLNALDRSRREFVSNVSHELKTPITSVRVLADSLNSMEGAPLEMYQEFMQDISKELERESNTIDDLLSMVRLEEGNAQLNISEVEVNTWLAECLKRLNPIAATAGIELRFESIRQVIAHFDEPKLSRVVTNLVENAIKYNQEGGHVLVTLDADYHYFFIKVEDDGPGIPQDALPHIFDRFYRVDKARSREAGGTGLGLAIAKQIVNMHHGAISVDSIVDEGSTFSLRVPLEYREKPEETWESEVAASDDRTEKVAALADGKVDEQPADESEGRKAEQERLESEQAADDVETEKAEQERLESEQATDDVETEKAEQQGPESEISADEDRTWKAEQQGPESEISADEDRTGKAEQQGPESEGSHE